MEEADWSRKHNTIEKEMLHARMKDHIEESRVFRQVCIDSPEVFAEDYELLWITWCILRGVRS